MANIYLLTRNCPKCFVCKTSFFSSKQFFKEGTIINPIL